MIEVANREQKSVGSLEELVEVLGNHIGRTVRIEAPPYEPHGRWTAIPKGVSFGTLKWIRHMDGQNIIKADLGRPFEVRDHGTSELINLTDTISVLADGVWHIVHAPKKREED